MRLKHLLPAFLFLFLPGYVSGQLIYIVTNVIPTELVIVDLSNNCSTQYVGPIVDQNGVGITGFDIAMCPDGTLYVTDGFNLYTVDPATAVATLVGGLGGAIINSLACNDMNQLFGAGAGLYQIDPATAVSTFLGNLPFPAGGDIVFYGGVAYYVTLIGLYEIDFNNPASSPFVMNVSSAAWGLAGYYESCNQIVSGTPLGEMYLIDPLNQTQTLLCQIPFLTTGMASLDDFNPPPDCDIYELDLDADNSSGAPNYDYFGNQVDCTNTSASIADSDVSINTGFAIDEVSISITAGIQDGPLEFLTLNNPPAGILVVGNGTANMSLINLGPASVADFEMAIASIIYENTASPPTSGQREIEVFFTSANGPTSNTATGFIDVVSSMPVVDLGGNQILCEGDVYVFRCW